MVALGGASRPTDAAFSSISIFGFFSPGGHVLPAMVDSSQVCVVPFGIDALVVVLAATYGDIFWIFPPIVTAVSLAGAALTYWIGRTAGDAGLPRFVAPHHLERIKARLDRTGSGTLAVAAVMPPPFPLTAVLLTCGALDFDRRRFLLVFGMMRLIRFSAEGLLARHYGSQVLEMLQWEWLQTASTTVALVGLAAAIVIGAVLWSRKAALVEAGL